MLFLLIFLSFSETTADLVPPFEIDSNGKIGFWEVGGSAIAYESFITLSTPTQFSKGCVWTNVAFPSINNWSVAFTLHIHQTTGGGFGFFFSDRYAADGTLNGGPNVFKGAALLGNIINMEDNTFGLQLSFIFNKGTVKLSSKELPSPDYVLPFSRKSPISFELKFDNERIRVFATTREGSYQYLFDKRITVDLSKSFMGISAQSDRLISRIDLYSVHFQIPEQNSKPNRQNSMGHSVPSSHYIPEAQTRLRNPAFNRTLVELIRYDESEGNIRTESSAINVLDVINEITTASNDVASFSDLNSFVRNNILNYSQKWQTRTIKLVERVNKARNVAWAAYNFTQDLVIAFNSTMKESLVKTNMKIIDLAELMMDVSEKGVDENNELGDLADDVNRNGIITWLLSAAVAEIIGVVLLVIFLNIPCINRKLIGTLHKHSRF